MSSKIENFTPDIDSQRGEGLTREVCGFITGTAYEDLPEELLKLGRKSILDGLGLALSGSVASSGRLVQDYLRAQDIAGDATVIGTSLKVSPRFAAFGCRRSSFCS